MYKLKNFSRVKVLVIGDVMIDKYLWGDVTRVSPEAPVPVVRLQKTSLIAGGAANVAANVAGLGGVPYLVSVAGNDAEGLHLAEILENSNVSPQQIIFADGRQTTVKTRIIAHNQQIARLDQETLDEIDKNAERAVWEKFCGIADEADIFVVSDYGKGVLSESLLSNLINYAKKRGKIIMVDPKGLNYGKYRGATVITPNKFEMAAVCGCHPASVRELSHAGRKLLSELDLKAVVVTRGEEGLTLIEPQTEPLTLAAVGRKVFDVTGAGDTFIAALAVAVGAGENLRRAAEIANIAAGLSVEVFGTTVIYYDELKKHIET